VKLKLVGGGYYLFNNAVFNDVRVARVNGSRSLLSRGMTVDVVSLAHLAERTVLLPCTLYMFVVGGAQLAAVGLESSNSVSFSGKFGLVTVDISRLSKPLTVSATKADPLVINWNITDSLFFTAGVPRLRIDVSQSAGDPHISFRGRKWTGLYHNISEKIMVIHGQADIHIENAKDDSGSFVGEPPHVRLIGDGDYYLNGKKQASQFSPGNHQDEAAADREDSFLLAVFAAVVGLGLVFVVGFVCVLTPRAKRRQPVTPAPLVETRANEDPDSSQFPVVDDEDHLEVQS
jgi:hypothetical protein